MDRKSLSRVQIKDATKGEISAVFSTFDVIDHDGDVTLKGAFTDGQAVVISSYGHGSWTGRLPVGKGVIREDGNKAVLDGAFFMDTVEGRDTFTVVKELAADGLQEWSYSLHDVESERGTKDGRNVRFLKKIGLVKEVSPVLMGAGIGTHTLDVKSADTKQLQSAVFQSLRDAGRERFGDDNTYVWVVDFDVDEDWAVFTVDAEDEATRYVRVAYTRSEDGKLELAAEERDVDRVIAYQPKALKFSEHADAVLADVDALVTRATEVMALRATKGKGLSDTSADQLRRVGDELDRLKALLEQPTPTSNDELKDAAQAEFMRFVASQHTGA